jgi:hypothetical protein
MHVLVGASTYVRPGEGSELIRITRADTAGYGENSRFRLDGDVALAQLERSAQLERGHVETARLMTPRSDGMEACTQITVTGFGRHSNLPEELRPREGDMHVSHEHLHPFHVCEESNVQDRLEMVGLPENDPQINSFIEMQREFMLEERHICFGGNSRSNCCNGDSGAPIFVDRPDGSRVIGGITSYGIGDGEHCGPSVDYGTRISFYANWIRDTLLTAGTPPEEVEAAFETWPLSPPSVSQKAIDTRCSEGEFQCRKSSKTCIKTSQVCDGTPDCPDGSDEPLECQKLSRSGRNAGFPLVQRGVSGKDGELVFTKLSSANGSTTVIENVDADSRVKFDEPPIPVKSRKEITESTVYEEHEDHVDKIKFAPRRYGHKAVVFHNVKVPAGEVVQKAPRTTTRRSNMTVLSRRRGTIIFSSDAAWIDESPTVHQGTTASAHASNQSAIETTSEESLPSENSVNIFENVVVDMSCVQANLELVAKRWEYMSGSVSALNAQGEEDITDIDTACDRMWKACLEQNPNLLDSVIGPQAESVRGLCSSVQRYKDWNSRQQSYVERFGSKYNDHCLMDNITGQAITHVPSQGINWLLLGTQIVELIVLLFILFKRFASRS